MFGPNWKTKAKVRNVWKDLVEANTQQWVTEGAANKGGRRLIKLICKM